MTQSASSKRSFLRSSEQSTVVVDGPRTGDLGVQTSISRNQTERERTMSTNLKNIVEAGDVSGLERALEQGSYSSADLGLALHATARAGDVEMLTMLVEDGAPVGSADDSKSSPLHTAIEHEQLNCVRVLVRLGADINARNMAEQTPLHHAVDVVVDAWEQIEKPPDVENIRLLLELGADRSLTDDEGQTPRDWAIEANLPELIEALRE